ncbi:MULTISPECIES: FecR family protein [unclassified Phenylobacterium]|uniref:FecR family protein n=1 Tax=unclassified Phenylobacterium TaxID=2640670 RepID=UPI0022B35BCB|nr:FecR family protein [Phenylobacterium sp. NIBR 498073]WGU42061.1 FecR family protein [Phenylobacterium sp. NIBR 498073]
MDGRDPIAKETRDEAARWYAKLNNTTITTQCLREFREWRNIGDNRQAYDDIDAFWKRIEALKADEEIKAAAQEALDRKKPGRPGPVLKGLIAAFLVASSGAALVYGYRAYMGTAYSTDVGEQRLVRLADGSRLHIDTDSQLRVRMRPSERSIVLVRGQAFFEVAHDPARPFVVQSNGTSVRALGTRFDVRQDKDGVQVILVEGKVQVMSATSGRSWTLAPGEEIRTSTAAPAPRPIDAVAATSWTSGRLVFQDQPLQSAIEQVNRYSATKVVLGEAGLARTPVSGSFETGDTEAFVGAVKDLYGLKVASRTAREIRLEPAA